MKTVRLLAVAVLAATIGVPHAAIADDRPVPLADVLELDATVASEVAPDLAVVTLAAVREGTDVAPLTREVNEALARAFADAKAVPGVIAANGGYSTSPRYEVRGSSSTRTGWTVRGEIVLKSKDFAAIGGLVGKLSQTLQITGSAFEISPELRTQESASLLDRGARAFQDKAAAATRAFGYAGWSIRQATIGSAVQGGDGRPTGARMYGGAMEMKAAAPLPVESGRVTLTLTVNGSVQMRR